MGNTIYSATGCARCKITKNYMKANGIDYEEFDFKTEGKDAFAKFYRANRKEIFRDKDGVEFPVFTDENVIRQGVSVVIAYLIAKDRLAGFIGRSLLHGEWLDGINVSVGNPEDAEALLSVMAYLKGAGLKLQITSDGINSVILEKIVEKGLADRILMAVKGPADLYNTLIDGEVDPEDVKKSLALAPRIADYQFFTTIAPVVRTPGESPEITYLTPEEIGRTAQFIEAATGSKKHPYSLKPHDIKGDTDPRFTSVKPLPDSAFFKYRTAARRYMVMAEIEK